MVNYRKSLPHENSHWRWLVYPINLFSDMVKLGRVVRFLIADHRGKIVAGGLFFRDGCTVMYWHGAADRDSSRVYPACAVTDGAVRGACQVGAESFNFGGSRGIESLEQFKAGWGGEPRENWRFTW